MPEVLSAAEALTPSDSKGYRIHRFSVPEGTRHLRLAFAYDPGGEPHSLLTLSLFDPAGFRGAGHRFAPRQAIELDAFRATPGFLAGPLPPGEWLVEVDVHCVIVPPGSATCRYALSAEAIDGDGETGLRATPAAPLRASAVAAGAPSGGPRRWLAGELHLHSDHSDGLWTTTEMAELARGRGLDFMFLTDHNTVSGVEALREAVGDAIAVLPGSELTTFHGHALALGPRRWLDWRTGLGGRSINDVARDVRAAGGAFVVAHPQAPPDPVCTGCCWTHRDFDPALAHGVEVWGGLWDGPEERNLGCLDLWRSWLNSGHRLAATGATDAHRPEDWQGAVPLTYLEAEDTSLSALVDALRSGRSFVSSGPVMGIRAVGADGREATTGGSLAGSPPPALEASCAAAPSGELRLVANGQVLARKRVEGEGTLESAARAGDRWCCAELWCGDVLVGVTSPVYLL